jgi:uncharacterized DUF497 family protein
LAKVLVLHQSTTTFERDSDKAEKNWKKHGVRFETAIRAFADPFAWSLQDRIEHGEMRWQTLGMAEGFLLLLVAHTASIAGGA